MTPEEALNEISPSAEVFANAVLARKFGICGVRFEKCIVIFCHDSVPGSEILKKALTEVTEKNSLSAIGNMG